MYIYIQKCYYIVYCYNVTHTVVQKYHKLQKVIWKTFVRKYWLKKTEYMCTNQKESINSQITSRYFTGRHLMIVIIIHFLLISTWICSIVILWCWNHTLDWFFSFSRTGFLRTSIPSTNFSIIVILFCRQWRRWWRFLSKIRWLEVLFRRFRFCTWKIQNV